MRLYGERLRIKCSHKECGEEARIDPDPVDCAMWIVRADDTFGSRGERIKRSDYWCWKITCADRCNGALDLHCT